MVTGLVPHVGGPILPPAIPTVLIGGMPAARMGDMATCAGPPDVIVKGSMTVLIGNQPAARIGDLTAHGGVIVVGCPTVQIGEVGAGSPISPTSGMSQALSQAISAAIISASQAAASGPQASTLEEAAAEGTATVEKCPYADQ
jgi:uncharacterized Zn-binding protein involved in type VI secretion